MGYKIVKYKKKKKCPFETYEPKKKIDLKKEHALPVLIWMSNLGGTIGFFVGGGLTFLKGLFRIKEKVKSISFNRRVVELRVSNKYKI